ncbi:MAG: hypothetical protein V4487_09295 [Chlamydiota bacterium]
MNKKEAMNKEMAAASKKYLFRALILFFLVVLLQGCYLFCFFKQDDGMMEEKVGQFVEENMDVRRSPERWPGEYVD